MFRRNIRKKGILGIWNNLTFIVSLQTFLYLLKILNKKPNNLCQTFFFVFKLERVDFFFINQELTWKLIIFSIVWSLKFFIIW